MAASSGADMAAKTATEWEATVGAVPGINATYGEWSIRTARGPIADKAGMAALTQALGFDPPEMVFSQSVLEVTHASSGLLLRFSAADALAAVLPHGERPVQVAAAKAWKASPTVAENVTTPAEAATPGHDWTFTTRYTGSVDVTAAGHSAGARARVEDTEEGIDFGVVGDTSEPIEAFDDVDLFESELDDNGQARYHVKVRCTASRTYILARFWLRVDKVLLRAHETRVWVEHAGAVAVREYSEKEVPWGTLKATGAITMRDSGLARKEDAAVAHMEGVGGVAKARVWAEVS